MNFRRLFQTIVAALGITLTYFLIQLIFGYDTNLESLHWNLLSNFLVVAILGFYAIHSLHSSLRLCFTTFIILYGIGYFNIIIEALIFDVFDSFNSIKALLVGIPFSLISSVIVVWVFGRFTCGDRSFLIFEQRTKGSWIGRILLANFSYIFIYLIAGMLTEMYTPGFKEFYEDKLPSPLVFFITNMFLRGFVFVAVAILIDRSVEGKAISKALLVALVFSVIGGIAPLILPNEFMPKFIRIAHGFEVGISNFLYGICVFLIVRSKKKDQL